MTQALDGMAPAAMRRIVIDLGEYAVSSDRGATLVTTGVGSGVAICLWDPVAGVAGLIHVDLPESRLDPARAETQPAAFADTGIPLLFHAAYERGAKKARCRVHLVGGVDRAGGPGDSRGRRNVLAARAILWRNGVLLERQEVGGTGVRGLAIGVAEGTVLVSHAPAVEVRP